MNELLAGRRLLVVEDEMLVLMMIEMMLADLGCESVVVASTLEAALARVAESDFDIAMLDMNLGGADSHLVADALDARQVPYLFCTGNASGDQRDHPRERPVLRKPFQFDALATALASLLVERDGVLPAA